MSSSALLTIGLALSVGVGAQSPIWGQCGGIGWTGATTCASGSVCTASNPWWFQCIPGEATPDVTYWFSLYAVPLDS
ncbi:carbohydrate-binding module family 1 protein [Collybiopsis luxurians FD-317 M1]|uniref:Carbohydrate-binding module family 1 protein n=1 Tax=Collybiopsis luxurians FD-317 M1 TaxID=944289 RepID=A0A0D0CEF0_9AGAR|nr:carbohydrate-binding module family 1 protein [Collybiopsis luxurians FD-317 M1]